MRLMLLLAAVVAALTLAATASAANTKATFTGQTLTDANGTVVENATIRVGSKTTGNGNTFTTCEFSSSGDQFLGQFESPDFASSDPDALLEFCSSHFADRAV